MPLDHYWESITINVAARMRCASSNANGRDGMKQAVPTMMQAAVLLTILSLHAAGNCYAAGSLGRHLQQGSSSSAAASARAGAYAAEVPAPGVLARSMLITILIFFLDCGYHQENFVHGRPYDPVQHSAGNAVASAAAAAAAKGQGAFTSASASAAALQVQGGHPLRCEQR